MRRLLSGCIAIALLTGCGSSPRRVGMVDLQKVTSAWPAAQRVQDRIESDRRSLVAASAVLDPQAQSAGAVRLAARSEQLAGRILLQVKKDAKIVARERGMRLIVTRAFVGFGGDDITDAVVQKIRADGAAADATLTAEKTIEGP